MSGRMHANAEKGRQAEKPAEVLWLAGSSLDPLPECVSATNVPWRSVCRAFAEAAEGDARREGFQLVIAYTPGAEGPAADFFARVLHNPLEIPVLAILPESPNPECRQAALDVTDDF